MEPPLLWSSPCRHDSNPLLCLSAIVLSAHAHAASNTRVVLPDNVLPRHYDVSFEPDSSAMTFAGKEAVRIRVLSATDSIVLNAASLVIDTVSLSGRDTAPSVAYDAKVETATFTFSQALAPGDYVLSLAYHGTISVHPSGVFALDYNGVAGKQRALFTQFENSDARRFMPCWDEPGIKASFQLTATVPL